MWPDGKTSKEKFLNLKAELWWICREMFKNTYEHFLYLTDPTNTEAVRHELNELISIPGDHEGPDAMMLSGQISLVKWMTTVTGKIQIEGKDALAKRGISSPDHADALMLTFAAKTAGEQLIEAYAA